MVENRYYVYVNSRDRLAGSDSDFTFNVQFPQDKSFDHVAVVNALIPKSYYLVQNGYNTFQLQEGAMVVTITVPVGNYLLTAFKNTIGNLLTSNSPNGWTYTVTYPSSNGADTGKFTYTVTGNTSQPSLIFSNTFFEPFGFDRGSTNIFVSNNLTSANVIKLQSEDRLFIHSDIVMNPGSDDILVSVNASTFVNYSSISYINYIPEYNCRLLNSHRSNVYRFTLTSEDGIVLDLNGLNMNITLVFFKHDHLSEIVKNFLRYLVAEK